MYPAIFEFLGTSELLVILVVALIIFGPRRLPQLSRQLGKSLGEFKRASEDFKRTWEKEVEIEKLEEEGRVARAMLQDDHSLIGDANERRDALDAAVTEPALTPSEPFEPTVARSSSTQTASDAAPPVIAETPAQEATGKRDWL